MQLSPSIRFSYSTLSLETSLLRLKTQAHPRPMRHQDAQSPLLTNRFRSKQKTSSRPDTLPRTAKLKHFDRKSFTVDDGAETVR